MQVVIIGGVWLAFSVIGYTLYKINSSQEKLRVMSCRSILKKYSKLDEIDKNSLF